MPNSPPLFCDEHPRGGQGSARAIEDARRFVLANTVILSPPHVPELSLHLADEAHDLWMRTEEELEEIGLPPPFWAFAWAGGQGLARYVLDRPDAVEDLRVVDFASGSGLAGIAAARAGARDVTCLDIDPFCGAAIELNAALNGVSLGIRTHDAIGEGLGADIVLAGDVFYDRELAGRLVPWFETLAAAGTDILVGDPGRAYVPRDRLVPLATYKVPVSRALEDGEIKRTTVWRWRRD